MNTFHSPIKQTQLNYNQSLRSRSNKLETRPFGNETTEESDYNSYATRDFGVLTSANGGSNPPATPMVMPRRLSLIEKLTNDNEPQEAVTLKPLISAPIQAKLTVGEPGDSYEQEADAVAQEVVNEIHSSSSATEVPVQGKLRSQHPPQPETNISWNNNPMIMQKPRSFVENESANNNSFVPESNLIQRNTGLQPQEEKKEDELMMKPLSLLVQRDEIATGGGEASQDIEGGINSAKGGGQPLDAGLQQSMGQAMGADFSGVKVHTDTKADSLNQSLQAKAFTTGLDVFFRKGEYQPASEGGQELIAHELTHVIQQSGEDRQGENIQRMVAIAEAPGEYADLERAGEWVIPTNVNYAESRWGGPVYESINQVVFAPEWSGTLAIVEHGAIGRLQKGAGGGYYSGEDIAAILMMRGLPHTGKVNIEFLCCNAGTREDQGTENEADTSVVDQVVVALDRARYDNVTVEGNMGLAFSSTATSPIGSAGAAEPEVLKTGQTIDYEHLIGYHMENMPTPIQMQVGVVKQRIDEMAKEVPQKSISEKSAEVARLTAPIYQAIIEKLRKNHCLIDDPSVRKRVMETVGVPPDRWRGE